MKITSILIFLIVTYASVGQVAPRFYSEKLLLPKLDSLFSNYGYNKTFYEKHKLPSLIALSHFPELKNTSIIFKRKHLSSTMAARPKGLQVLRKKNKRTYVVLINDYINCEVPPDSATFNARVGVIGHELAHILEYEQKSSLAIVNIGLHYKNKKFKKNFERSTDQRAIDHGLGWQCYDFAVFAFHYKNASSKYLKKKEANYMSPEEIKQAIR